MSLPQEASNDVMPTVPIPVRTAVTTFDAASKHERIEIKPWPIRQCRKLLTFLFNRWVQLATKAAQSWHWFGRVDPYVGYGTEQYSRLICRTVLADARSQPGSPMRGIKGMLAIPAPKRSVQVSIDDVPLLTVQVGNSEVFDKLDPARRQAAQSITSDDAGYLDLVAEHYLKPGVHHVSYKIANRRAVTAPLYITPTTAKIGVISDIDDTILVSQVPTVWKAAFNLLLRNPKARASVPGMSVLYTKLAALFPDAPFFYLSTSPWNVEASLRHFIKDHGFPAGPLLLRDLDPRPKTFVPSGVQHKLEFAEQLMADFPHMKFILIGDDGQKDPTTYATIARRYPGRVLAIGIRQLSPRESSAFGSVSGLSATQPIPVTDVPVFTGTTGANLMNTMLPYLAQIVSDNAI